MGAQAPAGGKPPWPLRRAREIRENVMKNNLWKRMIRNVICTTITVALAMVQRNHKPAFGKSAYLGAMFTVFAHPGRRVGQSVEGLILALLGANFGIGWAVLGVYLSSLLMVNNPSAAFAIRGVFLALAIFFHGFLRSYTPRMFLFVLWFLIECIAGLSTTAKKVSSSYVTALVYPILMASLVIFLVNLFVLPEFSSAFLGGTTLQALDKTTKTLVKAGAYFVETVDPEPSSNPRSSSDGYEKFKGGQASVPKRVQIASITSEKKKIRDSFAACRSAQNETQFEVAISHLRPQKLSPVSKRAMKKLVAHTIAVVGTCETRFALLGDEDLTSDSASEATTLQEKAIKNHDGTAGVDLEGLKARKEIENGDILLLKHLLRKIKKPYLEFQTSFLTVVEALQIAIAYSYDVKKLPSEQKVPDSVSTDDIETQYQDLEAALAKFDHDTAAALESAAEMQELQNEEVDVLPREELFLIASFVLNIRLAAAQVSDMLRHAKYLVQMRQESKWRRVYPPRIQLRKWLYSGGEEDETVPVGEVAPTRQRGPDQSNKDPSAGDQTFLSDMGLTERSKDLERGKNKPKEPVQSGPNVLKLEKTSGILKLRRQMSDFLEFLKKSDDAKYAFKITVAIYLVLFPAVVPSLNEFYYLHRGTWAAIQMIFVFDVAIGTSVSNFLFRTGGTTLGCLWGWAAYSAKDGNPYVLTAMVFIGLWPCAYLQLGSAYPKTGMVTIVSMCVLSMAIKLQTVPGPSTIQFLNRWIAFLIGGIVALVVEIVLLPAKARTKLVESIATAIRRVADMEDCIAYGTDEPVKLKSVVPPDVFDRFDKTSTRAKAALANAQSFLPACRTEPRLKGSFRGKAKIYSEIIFVLHQIVDRMDNMIQLRLSDGAGPMEEFNPAIYQYRRNLAGSILLVLYAVHEGLTTKYALPQFLPSARLAHMRLIYRIREVVRAHSLAEQKAKLGNADGKDGKLAIERTLRKRYMAWSAGAAAQAEIIEYLEELADLTKLLVGANEFRSGMLTRPTFYQYAMEHRKDIPREVKEREEGVGKGGASNSDEPDQELATIPTAEGEYARQADVEEFVPVSLKRIQTRKFEGGLKKRK